MSGGTAMFGETAWKPERVIDYRRIRSLISVNIR